MAAKEIALKVTVDTSEFSPELQDIKKQIDELKAANDKMANQIKEGFKSAEKASKGFGSGIKDLVKALGVVGVAMAVFSFMKDILSKNQKIMDALSVATTAFEIIINKLFAAVEPLGKVLTDAFENPQQAIKDLWAVIKENLINRALGVVEFWKGVGAAIKAVIDLDFEALKDAGDDIASAMIQTATGLDKVQQAAALDGLKNFVKDVQSATVAAVDQAAALQRLRNEVTLLNAEQRGLQLTYQKEAEVQRQIRDDISLTIEARQEANDRLGKILEDQFNAERFAADKRIELAEAELAINRGSIELQAALIDAKTELADLDERITGQRSEQLVNQKALEKELFDLQQELRVATLDAREKEFEELDIYYEMLQEKARLAGETDVEIIRARDEAIAELTDKFLKEDEDKKKAARAKELAEEKKLADSKVNLATSVGSVLGSIASAIQGENESAIAARKALAVAQIAIDTAVAISGAVQAASKSTNVYEMIAGIAAGIAAVIAGVGQATSILNSANVPGPSAPTPSASSIPSPQIQGVTTNTTELGGVEQAELAPIQAFVVETAITGSQGNVNQIESQATFGGG